MGEQSAQKPIKRICAGLLAHVDAGKTTLSEAMLFRSGVIRKLGRVDYKETYLDTYEMEKDRGITIFSKQAILELGQYQVTLLDTPGHVDFSGEMERTLQVLDYAILLINGADGVQGHTLTLWKLLRRYSIPVFLFINKMDQEGTDRQALLKQLQERLDEHCLDFSLGRDGWESPEFLESLALCSEKTLEGYLETGTVSLEEIRDLIAYRAVFPCFFGSALRLDGVDEFLEGIGRLVKCPGYPAEFGARVFKISRDDQGNRLTHMKITGGQLAVRQVLRGWEKGSRSGMDDFGTENGNKGSGNTESGNKGNGNMTETGSWEEKVSQIRIYSGARFEAVNQAEAGTVCAVAGLTKTWAGQGLGAEPEGEEPVLGPVLSYRIDLPQGTDVHKMLRNLRQLEEEEPLLHIVWNEALGEIHAQLMGEVQIDVLKDLIRKRFQTEVEFGTGNIVYRETIRKPVEGAGHFEPLRHYAEVHLLLEPGEPGSGLILESRCSEDILDRNWQRLVLTHLEEKEHRGVLAGAPITDMRITLISGRSHLKHTEGGDFRQATYRALRQGLRKAESVLLEPFYDFRLELPSQMVGRAMADIQKMSGRFAPPVLEGENAVLTGSAPVAEMMGYQREVASYTRGMGRLFCTMRGYEPCHNQPEVLERIGYDADRDLENTADSVFCSHGAGYVVPWYEADEHMHLSSGLDVGRDEEEEGGSGEEGYSAAGGMSAARSAAASAGRSSAASPAPGASLADDKELEAIFRRTFGESKRERERRQERQAELSPSRSLRRQTWEKPEPVDEYLLVDGYNVIFSWDELKELSKTNMDGARHRLMDILCNYQGFKQNHVILVFDAYKVEGHSCEVLKYHNIHVVYTKEAETADQYIEKTVHELGKKYRVTVATSDGLEQVIILGQGGLRMSANDLKEEIERTSQTIRETYLEQLPKKGRLLFHDVDQQTAEQISRLPQEEAERGGEKPGKKKSPSPSPG